MSSIVGALDISLDIECVHAGAATEECKGREGKKAFEEEGGRFSYTRFPTISRRVEAWIRSESKPTTIAGTISYRSRGRMCLVNGNSVAANSTLRHDAF